MIVIVYVEPATKCVIGGAVVNVIVVPENEMLLWVSVVVNTTEQSKFENLLLRLCVAAVFYELD